MSKFEYLATPSNWKFREGRAYTEDNILVYNIFVYKIPRKVTIESVRAYFQLYGKVLRAHIPKDKKNHRHSAPRVGFIDFEKPISATKVLQTTIHKINGQTIRVKASDSWRQPYADLFPPYNANFSNNVENPSSDSLLILNDDCLDHIFQKLTLREKLYFSATCTRFRNIFKQRINSEHKSFVLPKLFNLTLWEIREFFTLAGPSIECIAGSLPLKNTERVMEFIGKFCTNLKIICLDSSKIRSGLVAKLLPKNNCVTELRLEDCLLNDFTIFTLKYVSTLKKLTLAKNEELTGKNLSKLKFLTELNLDYCMNIKSIYLIDILKSLKFLKSLNIYRCDGVNTNVINQMVASCHHLEVLKMSCSQTPYELVARLPNLKHLEIISNYATGVKLELFKELVEHKKTQLEHLKIVTRFGITVEITALISCLKGLKELHCDNTTNLTDDCLNHLNELENLEVLSLKKCSGFTKYGFQDLLNKCTKLTHIMMQGCVGVTNEFVYEAIKILSKREKELQSPVLFSVAKSGVTEAVLKNEKYVQAKSVIKLSFIEYCSFDNYFDDPMLEFEGLDLDEDNDEDDFELDFDDDMDGDFSDDDDMGDDDIHDAFDMFGIYDDAAHYIIW